MKDKTELYARNSDGLTWQRAQKTADNPKDYNCVEVAKFTDGSVAVRDSNFPAFELRFDPSEWDAFMDGMNRKEFS
jgi:hypothetical protein